jgi:hypothetical protein
VYLTPELTSKNWVDQASVPHSRRVCGNSNRYAAIVHSFNEITHVLMRILLSAVAEALRDGCWFSCQGLQFRVLSFFCTNNDNVENEAHSYMSWHREKNCLHQKRNRRNEQKRPPWWSHIFQQHFKGYIASSWQDVKETLHFLMMTMLAWHVLAVRTKHKILQLDLAKHNEPMSNKLDSKWHQGILLSGSFS